MNASSGDAHGAASVRDYLNVVRRQKWIILQAVVLVPLAALLYSLHQTPVYSASSQVLLSSAVPSASASASSGTGDSSDVGTQAELAHVPDIARRSINQLGISMTPSEFLSDCSVAEVATTNILAFTCTSSDQALAARMVNEYATQYTDYRRELDTNSLETARQEIAAKIKQLSARGVKGGPLYDALVEREQQLQTSEDLQTANATVVKTADQAGKVSPRPSRNAFIGLILGIALGLALALLREALDTRVRSAQEVGQRLDLPLLGRLSEPPKRLRAENRLVMLETPTSIHAEAFRVLRANLEFTSIDRQIKTLMITSAVEQEGKSTTVANLAVALARAGQRVVLVDLDLRRPFLNRFFDLNGKPGVTQVVVGRASLEDALVTVPFASSRSAAPLRQRAGVETGLNGDAGSRAGKLLVLGAGAIPPDPGEFVGSQRLADLVAQLRDIADVVLIDTPPILQVGDAMVISGLVDGLLLATRMEKVRRPMLAEVKRVLETAPAQKLGFVVTGAEAEEGYDYGYGYGYSYGYGAGHAPDDPSGSKEADEHSEVEAADILKFG